MDHVQVVMKVSYCCRKLSKQILCNLLDFWVDLTLVGQRKLL